MFKMLSVKNTSNEVVTSYYMDIIYEAAKLTNSGVEKITLKDRPFREDIIIVSTVIDALKFYLKGYNNIIIWLQGILPEESYLKHKSKIRRFILSFIEKRMILKAKLLFTVSDEMIEHYNNKYNVEIRKKSFTMPCFNTEFNPEAFKSIDRYKNKVFTYVGSLSPWQCFTETLEIYSYIEQRKNNVELRIYTPSVEEAQKRVREKGIKNYRIEHVDNNELQSKLSKVTYGFIIRTDNVVNKVATPTKISSYLANGVVPIFSSSLRNFSKQTESMKYVYEVTDIKEDYEGILEFCECDIDEKELTMEYKKIFDVYYNREAYIDEISKVLKEIEKQ